MDTALTAEIRAAHAAARTSQGAPISGGARQRDLTRQRDQARQEAFGQIRTAGDTHFSRSLPSG